MLVFILQSVTVFPVGGQTSSGFGDVTPELNIRGEINKWGRGTNEKPVIHIKVTSGKRKVGDNLLTLNHG